MLEQKGHRRFLQLFDLVCIQYCRKLKKGVLWWFDSWSSIILMHHSLTIHLACDTVHAVARIFKSSVCHQDGLIGRDGVR
jgi:hypothetical protein